MVRMRESILANSWTLDPLVASSKAHRNENESALHFRELKGVQIEKITGGNRLERLRRNSLGRAVFKLSELGAWLGGHAMSLEQSD